MRGRGDQSRTQYGGAQQAPVYADVQGQETAHMQPMDLVSPELGSMAQFEPSNSQPNRPRKTGNGGDALVFIAMGLVSTALGLGLYAHVGIDMTVALLAALGLFVSTSFLHVFVRRMQGVDLLDRRVTALEDKVADIVPGTIVTSQTDHLETQKSQHLPLEHAPSDENQFAHPDPVEAALDAPAVSIPEAPVAAPAELPPAYTIPSDAAGGFGQEQTTASIADPIFDLADQVGDMAQRDTDALDISRFEKPADRIDQAPHVASDAEPKPDTTRNIDGLVRQLSQSMSGQADVAPATAAPAARERAPDAGAPERPLQPAADVAAQFGQRATPPTARREAGETPLISMPQPAESSLIGTVDSAANVTADPIGQAIHDAATRGEVDIYLQPILSIDDRKVRFFEVLGRVTGQGGEIIATEDHVELSRTVRASTRLDRAIMTRAARLLRKLSERRQAQPLFCNLSRESLAEAAFTQEFVEVMGGYRDLAPYIVFEIDHAAIIDADTTSINNLRALGAMGFRLSIDNVANVEQALANGRELDVSFIKLPYDVFMPMQQNQTEARALAATIQSVARESGMTLIIDRIDRKDQLAGVVGAGVNLGQGYLFSEPKPLLPQVAAEVAEGNAAA